MKIFYTHQYPTQHMAHMDAYYNAKIKVVGPDYYARYWGANDMSYRATLGDYDLDCKIGYGSSPAEAREELISQLENE